MPVAGPLIGAAASLGGAAIGAHQRNQAAAAMWQHGQYNPYNLTTGAGNASFSGNSATGTLSPGYQNLYGSLMGLAQNQLGSYGQGAGGYSGVPQSLYDEFIRSQQGAVPGSNLSGDGYNGLLSQYGQMAGNIGGTVGSPTGMEGLLSQYGNAASGAYNQLQAADPNQLFQNRYGLLQQLDQQRQQRLMGSNFDNQFGKGILASTAGQYQTQGLMDSFNQQATQNQLSAQDYATNQYQNNVGNLLNLGQGFQGALGASQGIDMNRLQGALGTLGAYTGLGQAGYGQNLNAANMTNALTQQRFTNAGNLFGAGQQAGTQQLGAASMGLQGVGGIDAYIANLIGLGGNLGSARSLANTAASGGQVNAANLNANAIGSAFNGLGTGLAGANWSGMFGGSKNIQPIAESPGGNYSYAIGG